MKKQFYMLALALAVSNAYATSAPNECGNHGNNCNSGTPGTAGSVNSTVSPTITVSPFTYNGNLNVNNNTAQGGAGGSSSSSSGASSAASASSQSSSNNAGNNQSVTFSSPDKVTVKSTGDAPAIIGTATAPCRVAVGASAGWLGGAFGIGTSVMDESCNLREVSRHLYNLGLKAEAVKVMCSDETAKAAMGALCQ